MPKKLKQKGKPEVHEDLRGFDIRINSFGEIESDMDLVSINEFLNKLNDKDTKKKNENEEE